MAGASSNADIILAQLRAFAASIDLTAPGADKSVGDDMLDAIAEGIHMRSADDQAGASGGWAPNAPKYAAWKSRRFDAVRVGQLTGQMLSLESLKGERDVTSGEAIVTYGTDRPADRFENGSPYPIEPENPARARGGPKDDPPTDRQKAEWFTEGGRPFFEVDDTIRADILKVAEEHVNEKIREANGS